MCWKTHRSVCLAADDTESTNTVAEKLEELTVKDKASEEEEEGEGKKETEEKQDEKKEVKTEEKN